MIQQRCESFADNSDSRFPIQDNDSMFLDRVSEVIEQPLRRLLLTLSRENAERGHTVFGALSPRRPGGSRSSVRTAILRA